MTITQLQKVVFLDRDGVINEDSPNYIKNWSEFKFIPGSIDAIKKLSNQGFTAIIITNQSIINRKLAALEDLKYTHDMMRSVIESQGGSILDIFYCPHIPEDNCRCRKPKPGLIHDAQRTYNIDLKSSVMVGDYITDFQCAINAGIKFILVKTGRGQETEKKLVELNQIPNYIADNLQDAANWIVNQIK